jgi:dTDP-4-dehydrorhamnose 3,5-epimerase
VKFTATQIPDVVIIEPVVHEDERGFLMETWRENTFREAGIDASFVQDNHSRSSFGALRGLHYQVSNPQAKLVRVIQGEVFDVAVDLRRSSPTFGQWAGEVLSADNRKLMWIPAGFAHGFLVLSEIAEFTYRCTDYFAPEYERTLAWNDADVAIDWPLGDGQEPLLSDKDREGASLKEAETYA